MKGINIAIFVLLLISSNTDAKGGRGSSGGSRGSSSRGSSSRGSSSGGGWFGSSRSSPSYSSPSYSRPSPSPSYTYSAPSPSYTYSRPSPSYTHNSPSSSYGWNTGGSSPSGSSFGSASKPSSTNYGWNVGSNTGGSSSGGSSFGSASKPSSTNYGWNVGSNTGSTNTGSKPETNIGWNFNNPSAPVGPPPSYPGMQNRPVPSHNSPPSYSPSFNNPPAYSPSHFNSPSYNSPSYRPSPSYSPSYNSPSYRPSPSYSPSYSSPSYNSRPSPSYGSGSNIPRQNIYGTHSSSPGYYTNSHQNHYGNTFGSQGVPGNTYISNNYYGNQRSGGSGFLTNAMFYGAGIHSGYGWGRSSGYNNYGHNGYYGNSGYGNSYGYSRRQWDEEEDRKWRQTTRAPYFENKVPGEDKILPASAVIGAATAFGLATLLPLNVPSNKPLMYCNNTDLMQSQIQINNEYIYQCINGSIVVSSLDNSNESINVDIVNNSELEVQVNQTMDIGNQTQSLGNQTNQIVAQFNHTVAFSNQTVTLLNTTELQVSPTELPVSTTGLPINTTESTDNSTELPGNTTETIVNQTEVHKIKNEPKLSNKIMQCDLSDEEVTGNLYCKKGTLMSKSLIFCNSTTLLNVTMIVNGTSLNTTTSILNCFEGQVPEKQASFIPTTTQAPVTTTEKSLSFGARAHMFFLRILGKGDIADQKTKLTPIAEDIPQLSNNETWIPEALTIPPDTTTTTTEPTSSTTSTEAPFEWMMAIPDTSKSGTLATTLSPVSKEMIEMQNNLNNLLGKMGTTTTNPLWIKVYKTTSEPSNETTSVYDGPYEWMRPKFTDGGDGSEIEPVPKDLVEITMKHNYTIPSDWVKVPKNNTMETTTLNP